MTGTAEVASRLCAECGMCCNGVLFHSVRLIGTDSAPKLAKLGLRAKRRQGILHILQPCPAYRENTCSIYADRPERCREFHCRQLIAVADGSATELDAMRKIAEARELVAQVRALFRELGDDREHRSFSSRISAIFTPPLMPGAKAAQLRKDLRIAWNELHKLLNESFRTEAVEALEIPE